MSKKLKEGGLGDLAHAAERDHEVQMARADLYKIAKYAIKLHDMLKTVSEAEGIEGWQQSKITKAADYIGSVYHAMDYDMKFAESKSTKNVMKRSKTMTEEPMLVLILWRCRHSRNTSVNLRVRVMFNMFIENASVTMTSISSLNDMMKIVMCCFLFTPFILLMVVRKSCG